MTVPEVVPVDIREMSPDDAAAAASLSGELGYPLAIDAMRARIAQVIAMPDHGVYVACHGGEVVGWIHVAAALHLQAEPRAEIGGLVVAERIRSAGIGARLVQRAEAWARTRGFAAIVVRSQIMREAAHRFYLREGYERTKTSAVFSKTLGAR